MTAAPRSAGNRLQRLHGYTNGEVPIELVPVSDGLVAEVIDFVRDYVVMTERQRLICALWTIHTHAFAAAEQTPYIFASSAERRCGKSRLLEVLGLLVRDPVFTANTSAPALFRTIEVVKPTLLMDESDATFGRKNRPSERAEDLRGILNAGHREHGGYVLRCVGQNHKVARFRVFCPKAFAGIGTLPDTIADRSIPIRLQAKTKMEPVKRFLHRDAAPTADALRDQIAAWAAEHVQELAAARPEMPGELDDRMVEGGEQLIAIADRLACGAQARAALVALCTGERLDSTESMGLRLLADIRTVFTKLEADLSEKRDRKVTLHGMQTVRLLGRLRLIEEAPWATYSRQGLDARSLANLLRPYGVHSKPIRPKKRDGKVYKGYERADLAALWERYL